MSTIDNENMKLAGDATNNMDIDDNASECSSTGSAILPQPPKATNDIAGDKSDIVDEKNPKSSDAAAEDHVKFGSVHVHTHKMTLGDNPGAKSAGPPVTIDWKVEDSERFEDVNGYCMKYHGTTDSQRPDETTETGKVVHAHKITHLDRIHIAGQDHEADSIRKHQLELYKIKKQREQSALEDPDTVKEKRHIPYVTPVLNFVGEFIPKEKTGGL